MKSFCRKKPKGNLFVLENGLGDVIKSIHYCNFLFSQAGKHVLLNVSFRPEFISPFLDYVCPCLPKHNRIDLEVEVNLSGVSDELIQKRFPEHKIYRLGYLRERRFYDDNEWLSLKRFDYLQLVGTPIPELIGRQFIVINRNSVSPVTTISDSFWKKREIQAAENSYIPVLVGGKPSNAFDLIHLTQASFYQKIPATLDLRDRTSIEQLFWLLSNASMIYSTANGIAVLAHELKSPIETYGVMGANAFTYEKRFFDRPYKDFVLRDIDDVKYELANSALTKNQKIRSSENKNYIFLSNSYRDYLHFEDSLKYFKDFFVPLTFFNNKREDSGLIQSEKIFINQNGNSVLWSKLDIEFVFEYPIKFHGLQATVQNIFPLAQKLACGLENNLQSGDHIFTWNSGEWVSRLIYEISRIKDVRCIFLESFMFHKSYMASKMPFTLSKFGNPEFWKLYNDVGPPTDHGRKLLAECRSSKISKYYSESLELDLPENFDFIVGQVPNDTNVVCTNSIYKTTEEMAALIAYQHPNRNFVYKPHPESFMREPMVEDLANKGIRALEDFPNVQVIFDGHIHDIIRKAEHVHSLSSTCGTEAGLLGKDVTWYTKSSYNNIEITNEDDAARFMQAANEYSFFKEDIGARLSEYVS